MVRLILGGRSVGAGLACVVALGCSGNPAELTKVGSGGASSSSAATSASSSSAGGGGGAPCGAGQVPGEAGACVDVGLQGCVDPDGVCRPSLAKCDVGTIPHFTKGCIAVGVPSCDKLFFDDTGMCDANAAACSAGDIADPQRGCVPLDGDAGCGSGKWGAIPDDAKNVYVDAAYAGAASDGSKAKPFKTLADALAVVPRGGRVAVAAGRYTEAVSLDAAVEIAGKCPSQVLIDGVDDDPISPKTIGVSADGVTIRGVTIGGDGHGVHVDGAASVLLDHVVVTNALAAGVFATAGADVRVTSSLVSAIRRDHGQGYGCSAEAGAHVTVEHSAIVGATGAAVAATDAGTKVTLTDVAIEGTLGTGFFVGGDGVLVTSDATAEIEAVAFVRNRWNGIDVSGDGEVTVSNSSFLGQPRPAHLGTYSAAIMDQATLTMRGCAMAKHHVTLQVAFTDFHLSESLLRDNGVEMEVGDGDIRDTTFYETQFTAINAANTFEQRMHLHTSGLLIERPRPNGGYYGVGIIADGAVSLELSGSYISKSNVAALLIEDGADATLADSSFVDVAEGKFTYGEKAITKTAGDGVVVSSKAAAHFDRLLVDRCARAGFLFDSALGGLKSSLSTRNKYGVVLDGSPAPMVDATNAFIANTELAELDDGNLAVPPAQPVVPQ